MYTLSLRPSRTMKFNLKVSIFFIRTFHLKYFHSKCFHSNIFIHVFTETDPFQTYCSISGIAYYNMMSSSNEVFFSPGEELYTDIRKNITGGFASGFTRYAKKGVTEIRDEEGEWQSNITIPFHFKFILQTIEFYKSLLFQIHFTDNRIK